MKRFVSLLMGLLLCLLPMGCAPVAQEPAEEAFSVAVSFHPMLLLTRMVTQGVPGVDIHCMAQAHTGCLHDYQLLPGDVKGLQEADLFIINGLGMESFIDSLLVQLPALHVVNTTEAFAADVEAMAAPGEEVNGHVWLSVPYAMQQLEVICAALCADDPVHAEAYRANTEAYQKRMEALEQEMRSTLAPMAGQPLVSFHDAFSWYEVSYGLTIADTLSLHEEEPSTRQLTDLVEIIRTQHVKALLVEPYIQEPPAAAAMVSRESGCPLVVLDPITSGEDNPEAYFTAMVRNAQTLAEVLP